jgi:hypothetical protein
MAKRIVKAVLSRNATDKVVKNILETVNEALLCHRTVLRIAADTAADNPRQIFALLVREMLSDGRVVNLGRIAVVFALAIFFQKRFGIDLESETLSHVEAPLDELVDDRLPRLLNLLNLYITRFFFL